MKYVYLNDGTICTHLSRYELDDLSINIPKALTFFIIDDCVLEHNLNKIIIDTDEHNNIVCSNTKTCKKGESVSILLESDTEKYEEHILKFVSKDNELVITLSQQYVDVTDRLIVMLNNYGIQVSDDWVKCFYESDIHELNIDCVLKDRKMSEFMLEFMNLVGLRGTYKTLFSAVSYFGYKDMIWFEEHWISMSDGKTKRYTTINNEFIDKSITNEGYTKIGDMTMFYSLDMLDPEEPYDEGGLPNFVKRNISFDDLYAKLLLLRSILNKWFIPWDSYIVDIIGEIHAIGGFQKKWWVANDMFINQNEESRYKFIEIEYDNVISDENDTYHLKLTEEKMLVDMDLYTVLADDTLSLNQQDTAHIKDILIKIEKLGVDELIDLKDFDIITKFQRKDVAILLPKIKLNITDGEQIPWYINGFKIRLLKLYDGYQDVIYMSKMLTYDELITNMRFGITQLGEYEFSILIFDCWGYQKQFPIKFVVTKDDITVDFLLMRPQYLLNNKDYIKRTLEFDSAHETLSPSGIPVIDAVSTQRNPTKWDINKPDEIVHSVVNRYYSTKVQNMKMLLPIRRYGSIPIIKQDHLPINEYWAPYNLLMINCMKYGANISLKEFAHHDYVTIIFENELQFIHDLLEESKKVDSPFGHFEFDSQLLNATERERLLENENINATTMLMIYSKYKSFSLDKVIFRIEVGDDVITNDSNVLGVLNWYQFSIMLYDRQLTLYSKNDNSKTMIVDKESSISIYHNYMYPALGSDSVMRMNAIYNTTKTELGRFVLYDRVLTLYDKPLMLYTNSDFKDPNINALDYESFSLANRFIAKYNNTTNISEYKSDKMIVDYHLKFRMGSTWFYSIKEYGKPIMIEQPDGTLIQEFETPPLTFEHLVTMFNQYHKDFTNELGLPQNVLDNIDIYYYDSNFVIRCRNGYDIEIMHMNIGHKIANNRIGSISKMYITVSGTSFQPMSVVIAMPNEEIKFQNCDVSWKIYEHFTKQLQFSSEGYVLRYIPIMYGLYDIEMIITDKVTLNELVCKKDGAILIE